MIAIVCVDDKNGMMFNPVPEPGQGTPGDKVFRNSTIK